MRPYAVFLALIATAPLFAESAPAPTAPKPAAAPVDPAQALADKRWSKQATSAIEANVDGRAITTSDLWNELAPTLSAIHQKSANEEEFVRLVGERSAEIRDSLTDKYLILSEVKEKGMQLPASVVQEQIEEQITRVYNGDRNEYLRTLRLQGRTPLDDRKKMEEDILVDIATNQIRKSLSEVSPERIQRYYEANKDAFSQPAGVKLSQIILWPGAADSDADVRRQAEEIVAKLDKGESFADLAKKYSKDDTREQGGETPWHNLSELNAEIAKQITPLKDGQHTKPIEFMVGGRLNVYIYRLDASRAEGALPMAEVREKIEGILLGTAKKAARDEWMDRLRQHFYVRYYN